jgi:hypothetical protein
MSWSCSDEISLVSGCSVDAIVKGIFKKSSGVSGDFQVRFDIWMTLSLWGFERI